LRAAVLAAGAKALGMLLRGIGVGRREEPVVCSCGLQMESQGLKEKLLTTILGTVSYRRSMYQCPGCGKTRYPGDEELDVIGTRRSPGLRRMMARVGSQSTFKEGKEDLRVYAGIEVSAKDVERVAEGIGQQMEDWFCLQQQQILDPLPPVRQAKTIPIMYVSYDGTGVPMTRAELAGRKGKQPDGSSRTLEVKLGCVFTQTGTDENGFAVRDPESTTFVGAIEKSEEFGWRIYAEAERRGLYEAEQVVVLGDAAEWIRTIKEQHFPQALQIVDLYHAREHVSELSKYLFGSEERNVVRFRTRSWTWLDDGKVERIIEEASKNLSASSNAEKAEKEITFLDVHKELMRYARFRKQNLFVGSGVMEAGCKTLIGQRLKQSGMEWSVRGANAIIALRCVIKSGRLQEYWETRAG
jgi:hypothetical protein